MEEATQAEAAMVNVKIIMLSVLYMYIVSTQTVIFVPCIKFVLHKTKTDDPKTEFVFTLCRSC